MSICLKRGQHAILLLAAASAQAAPEPDYAQELAALAAQPAVAAALAAAPALEPALLETHLELNAIAAPPFGEQDRAARFAQLIREAGLDDVAIDGAGNVVGRRPGASSGRRVAITAHLDTVFPPGTDLSLRRDGDWYCAPGIGDNTRGLALLLGLLRLMQAKQIETRDEVWFVGNVGEEGLGDLRGVKHLFRTGAPAIDALIAIDGGETGRLVYGGVGSHRYRISFHGPGGHSWGAFGTANPAHALSRAIAQFVAIAPAQVGEGEKATWNVGRIGGGTSVNSVPFEAWAEVDLRSGDQARIDALDAALHKAVAAALEAENAQRTEGEPLSVAVQRVGTRPAARSREDLPLVQRARAALELLGVEPELSISSTDANLPISLGIPAVTLSRGGETRRSHSPEECWRGENASVSVQAALLTLLAEAGQAISGSSSSNM